MQLLLYHILGDLIFSAALAVQGLEDEVNAKIAEGKAALSQHYVVLRKQMQTPVANQDH